MDKNTLPSNRQITDNLPFGYLVDRSHSDHIIIDPEAAPYIRFMFDECLRGSLPNAIAKRLTNINAACSKKSENRRKLPRYSKHSFDYWNSQSIKKMLINIIYTGQYTYPHTRPRLLEEEIESRLKDMDTQQTPKKPAQIIQNHHEAYITLEQRDCILEVLKQARKINRKKDNSNTPENIIFREKIICANCNRSMRYTKNHKSDGKYNGYYQCCSQFYHVPDPCPQKRYPMSEIISQVHDQLAAEAAIAKKHAASLNQGINSPDYLAYDQILRDAIDTHVSMIYKAGPDHPSVSGLKTNLTALITERTKILDVFTQKNLWINLYSKLPDEFEINRDITIKYISALYVDLDGMTRVEFKKQEYKERLLPFFDIENAKHFVKELNKVNETKN